MAQLIRQRSESVDIRGLLDADTPTGERLSGIYKRSFAYHTLKDRLPVILTKIIDILSRDKDELAEKYGCEAKEDVKSIVGFVSKLKNELVTNKPLQELQHLPGNEIDDVDKWNEALAERTEIEGETPTWFKTLWLFCECYMYRRLNQEIASTKWLNTYDPFEKQKKDAYANSLPNITSLVQNTMNVITEKSKNICPNEMKHEFVKLIKLNLWGNRCDLSLTNGADITQSEDPVKLLESFEKDILVDDSDVMWDILVSSKSSIVDIILDNSAYELITDLCLTAFLTTFNLAGKVRFYVKRMPWFVSDVTINDFYWTIETMRTSDNEHLVALSNMCETYLKNGKWSVEVESFWTEPYTFSEMKAKDPCLYQKLSEAELVIVKGDLNYRKLLGDINWEYTTSFCQALQEFHPTNVASLRTLKCDLVVGLAPCQAMKVQEEDPNWMLTGRFGTIQVSAKPKNVCVT